MLKSILHLLTDERYPKWFRLLNGFSLTPILAWPIIAFASTYLLEFTEGLFIDTVTSLVIALVNFYPLYLLRMFLYSFQTYSESKQLAVFTPLFVLGVSSFIVIQLLFLMQTS